MFERQNPESSNPEYDPYVIDQESITDLQELCKKGAGTFKEIPLSYYDREGVPHQVMGYLFNLKLSRQKLTFTVYPDGMLSEVIQNIGKKFELVFRNRQVWVLGKVQRQLTVQGEATLKKIEDRPAIFRLKGISAVRTYISVAEQGSSARLEVEFSDGLSVQWSVQYPSRGEVQRNFKTEAKSISAYSVDRPTTTPEQATQQKKALERMDQYEVRFDGTDTDLSILIRFTGETEKYTKISLGKPRAGIIIDRLVDELKRAEEHKQQEDEKRKNPLYIEDDQPVDNPPGPIIPFNVDENVSREKPE
jgi:hypothetical protein